VVSRANWTTTTWRATWLFALAAPTCPKRAATSNWRRSCMAKSSHWTWVEGPIALCVVRCRTVEVVTGQLSACTGLLEAEPMTTRICVDGNEAAARVAYSLSEVVAILPYYPGFAHG